jgi:ABC-type spermidine/putrescine transport systems, ATPase components
VGIESGKALLASIDPSIEEAAVNLGADSRKTFSRITLPMILPAFFSGLVFAFVRAMTAVSAAIFLVSSRWNLMTVHIMAQVESGNLGAAAAYRRPSGPDRRRGDFAYPRGAEIAVQQIWRSHAAFLGAYMSVRLVNITKEFADPEREGGKLVAVRDFNLEIQEGEFVTLLGPSGCGKTTTLRMIAGFEMPTTGEVWIGGKNVSNDPPNKRDTSMVFQSYAIFPHMSVEQNVGFGLELKGRPKAEITCEVRQIMEVMGIADLAHRRPDQLSGGQQQRVALARAIVNRPSVLLFDEPLSNLDAKLPHPNARGNPPHPADVQDHHACT